MAQQYLFPCPSCGAKTQVDSRQAGETLTCKCGARLAVPTLRGLRELETTKDTGPALPQRRKWSPIQGVLFSLGIVAALLGGLMAARHFVILNSLTEYTVDRTAEVDKYTNEMLDGLSLTESMEVWDALRSTGLGEDHLPPWKIAQQMSTSQKRSATIWSIVAGLGVAAVVTALVMSGGKRPASKS